MFNRWRDDPATGVSAMAELSTAICDSVREATGASLGVDPLGSLLATLDHCATHFDGELLLIFDQFEEFFLYHPDPQDPLIAALGEAITDRSIRARFLISVREDALARLDLFADRIHHLYEIRLRLDHLDRRAGADAIRKPIERYNQDSPEREPVIIEDDLVAAVLEEVKTAHAVLDDNAGHGIAKAQDSDGSATRIEAPFLQLVMLRLWEEERRGESRVLRRDTLDRLGGKERIMGIHLDEALRGLTARERALCARAFRYLVTPSNTKIAYTAADLAEYAGTSESALKPVLEKLASGRTRILRTVAASGDGGEATAFEIFHDVLARSILAWRERYGRSRRRRRLQLVSAIPSSCGRGWEHRSLADPGENR